MPIVQQGSINTTALVVPDLYVQIVPPQNLVLNGVPTNVVGMVGTASWGPVGQPVIVATMADYARNFGPVMPRKFDMGTHVATAVQQGAQNFRCVRVTDGTDTAAQSLIQGLSSSNFAMALTAACTGSLGNQLVATLAPGSKAGTWKLTIALPGLAPEVFDNVGGSGVQFWQNMVAAVNTGTSIQRGPSQFCTAQMGLNSQTASAPCADELPILQRGRRCYRRDCGDLGRTRTFCRAPECTHCVASVAVSDCLLTPMTRPSGPSRRGSAFRKGST